VFSSKTDEASIEQGDVVNSHNISLLFHEANESAIRFQRWIVLQNQNLNVLRIPGPCALTSLI